MVEKDIVELIERTLEQKMEESQKIIKYTFFELKIKYDLAEKELNEFLKLARNKLENYDYSVYFTGAQYVFEGEKLEVTSHDLMIATKNPVEE